MSALPVVTRVGRVEQVPLLPKRSMVVALGVAGGVPRQRKYRRIASASGPRVWIQGRGRVFGGREGGSGRLCILARACYLPPGSPSGSDSRLRRGVSRFGL